MLSATTFEWATASTTVLAPSTTSPDAKTPSLVVLPFSSAFKSPLTFVSRPFVLITMLFLGDWLTATIIESHSYNFSVPSR